ncbi:MAG: hypothetical protein RMM58_15170 [Chloroflexota bacterium]|nr:hypothetical protein [Dehalococcoidia bacterium]MDW8255211.1 hypothetical protein [Chloroflexota bacterium]
MTMRRGVLPALLLLLSACAPAPPAAPPTVVSAEAPVVRATPSPPLPPDVVRIELYEWSIHVEPAELPPGRYRVEIVNLGRHVHSVSVAGPGVDFESRRLRAGGVQQTEIEFRPGEYTLWCPIGDHRDDGMLTYLTVVDLSPRR